jgi:hypothetical protein
MSVLVEITTAVAGVAIGVAAARLALTGILAFAFRGR